MATSDPAGITEDTGSHEVSCVSFISYGHYYEPELATSHEKAQIRQNCQRFPSQRGRIKKEKKLDKNKQQNSTD